MTAGLCVVVLTFNEELNLEACLSSVSGWVRDLVVVDSGSTDDTLAIARRHGARVLNNPFENHSKQWAWALQHGGLQSGWVLGLDADQRVTPELRSCIEGLLRDDEEHPGRVRGAYVRRRQVFRGRWIRHGGYYPKYLLKLFRLDSVRLDPGELVDHHFHVDGLVIRLEADLVEENRNEDSIDAWLAKHIRYARLQAQEELQPMAGAGPARLSGSPDERTRWLKGLWRRLPLFVRPWLYFFYRYVIRLGFLDGREGFVFHFMQALWYRVLVDVRLSELAIVGGSAGNGDSERTEGVGPASDSGARS
jgi:glycosyltransferase involved in cell wall biosynthesis